MSGAATKPKECLCACVCDCLCYGGDTCEVSTQVKSSVGDVSDAATKRVVRPPNPSIP